ncbi:hypothetical protein MUP35_00485 [Patescibacteria group bacterium]|nr:hypothetical protein [Patescibacteria group bacterium]
MVGNNNKEIEPQNKQSLKTTLEGFAKRIESFVQMPKNPQNLESEVINIRNLLNQIFDTKIKYFREKYELGRYDGGRMIKKILKKEELLLNEQDPPEQIRLISNFKGKSILKITYSGQDYFLGYKKNGNDERILFFASNNKGKKRMISFNGSRLHRLGPREAKTKIEGPK